MAQLTDTGLRDVRPPPSPGGRIAAAFAEMAEGVRRLAELEPSIAEAARLMAACLGRRGRVFFCGNGGSAADAQHLAAELLGRLFLERAPWPAIALTVNTSALTAIGNDYGYDDIFERQLRGLGSAGDVLVALSTSGSSANVVRAIEAARAMKITVIGLTGEAGGRMAGLCDLCLQAPARSTPRVQELHIAIGHVICEIVEAELA